MDCENIFTEDNGINRIKSWLIGSSDGQTYPINDYYLRGIGGDKTAITWSHSVDDVLKKRGIKLYEYDFSGFESEWDSIIGWKHDYKVDDPNLQSIAENIEKELLALVKDINEHPEKYFECVYEPPKQKRIYWWEANCNEYAGFSDRSDKIFGTQEDCYKDMLDHALEKMKWNIQYEDVTGDCAAHKNDDLTVTNDGWGIHYDLECHPHMIQHKSYSGIYTYRIKTKLVDCK